MSKEAMKLALEALEEAWYHVGTFQPTEKAIDLYDEARTALREALAEQPAQQALDKMAENARELGLDYEPAQRKPCEWQREDDDHMPDTWRSDCGVMWTFTDGGPVENDMKHCCGCGAKLREKNNG